VGGKELRVHSHNKFSRGERGAAEGKLEKGMNLEGGQKENGKPSRMAQNRFRSYLSRLRWAMYIATTNCSKTGRTNSITDTSSGGMGTTRLAEEGKEGSARRKSKK